MIGEKCKGQMGCEKMYNINFIGVTEGRRKIVGGNNIWRISIFFQNWWSHATDPRGTRNHRVNTKKIIVFLGANNYISKIKMTFEWLKYSKFTSPQRTEMYPILHHKVPVSGPKIISLKSTTFT